MDLYEHHPCDARVTGPKDVCPSIISRFGTGGGNLPLVLDGFSVRTVTPDECESMQGFPRGHTSVPFNGKGKRSCPSSRRLKSVGNSMAVACMRWIGERLI